MKTLLLLGIALCAIQAQAGNVVKTFSGPCGEDPAFRGSGFAFSTEGIGYVVTSEHVLLQDPAACASVQLESGARVAAELVAVDWGSGLGLLKLKDSRPVLPDLSVISAANLASAGDGGKVEVAGYPYRSSALYRDARGSVLRLRSDRHLLPLVPNAIEIVGAHGEFGMSGGPVLGTDGKLLGLLSHQILHLTEGGDTRVVSPEQDDGQAYNQLLAIPVDYVESWLKKALAADFRASFVRDPAAQTSRISAVDSAGLSFRAVPAAAKQSVLTRARAGGEDGAGIGGQPDPEGSVEVRVTAAPLSGFATAWGLPSRMALFNDWTRFTLNRSEVRVPYLLERSGPELKRLYFASLEAFFQLIQDPSVSVPVLVDGGTSGSLDERALKVRAVASQLGGILGALEKNTASPRVKSFLGQMHLFAELGSSDNWSFLTKEDLERAADTNGTYQDAWRELFSRDFDDSVELLRSLNRMVCLIGYRC